MVALCDCGGFVLWYTDRDGPPLDVCRCGHPSTEHIDILGPCSGEVVLSIPVDVE